MDAKEYVFKPGFEQGTIVDVSLEGGVKELGVFECWDEDRRGFWLTQLLPGYGYDLGRLWIQSEGSPRLRITERPGERGNQAYLWTLLALERETNTEVIRKALSLLASQERLVELACRAGARFLTTDLITEAALEYVTDAQALRRGIASAPHLRDLTGGDVITKYWARLKEITPHGNGTAYRG